MYAALLLLSLLAPAETLAGKVVAVVDGDTIRVLDSRKVQHMIRLHGIDAPEGGQAFGQRSKQHLSAMIMGKDVVVAVSGLDKFGRELGVITFAALPKPVNANISMVREGMAWHFVRYAPRDKELAAAEAEARKAKRGLWADKAPVPPWDYRAAKQKSEKQRK